MADPTCQRGVMVRSPRKSASTSPPQVDKRDQLAGGVSALVGLALRVSRRAVQLSIFFQETEADLLFLLCSTSPWDKNCTSQVCAPTRKEVQDSLAVLSWGSRPLFFPCSITFLEYSRSRRRETIAWESVADILSRLPLPLPLVHLGGNCELYW
jgi:hypothetical protein